MENLNYKSSILISLFKRKGGEGFLTKIINDDNRIEYFNQLKLLEIDEDPLICYKEDEMNWFVLTDRRIFNSYLGEVKLIFLSELFDVNMSINAEFNNNILNKENFTRLTLTDNQRNNYSVKIEKGLPYQGLYQVLHHIVIKNKTKQ